MRYPFAFLPRATWLSLFTAVCATVPVNPAVSQEPNARVIESGRHLVVRLTVAARGEVEDSTAASVLGSGVVVAVVADSVFIATTDHTLKHIDDPIIRVQLQFGAREVVLASVLLRDTIRDLAILSAGVSIESADALLPFVGRTGEVEKLSPGDRVFPIACYDSGSCRTSTGRGFFVEAAGLELEFRSDGVVPGFSGGGLFAGTGEFLGMITRDSPPVFFALRADSLGHILERRGFPSGLQRTPRDPFARTASLVVVGTFAARRPSGSPYSAWVEWIQDSGTPWGWMAAARLQSGAQHSLASLHIGVGSRRRFGSALAVRPSASLSGYLDGGVGLSRTEGGAEVRNGVGWSAGLSVRMEVEQGYLRVGFIAEIRKLGTSFSSHTQDALNLGLLLGYSP